MKDMARNIEWIGEEHEEAVSKQMAQKCRQSMDHTVLAKMVQFFQEKQTYSVRVCVVLVFVRTPRVGESQIAPWTHENDAPGHAEAYMIALIPQPPSQRHRKVPAS